LTLDKTLGGVSVTIKKSDGSQEDYADPSLYLDPSTNKIILFYLSTTGYSGDPANCTTCPIRSGTEVDGSDGTQFVMDSGDRASVSGGKITDPDIFYDGSKYILYIAKELQQVLVYTSTTLQGTYSPVTALTGGILTNYGSVPAGYYDSVTGKYWTYITVLSPTTPSVIKRAVHNDFSKQLTDADFTTVIPGSNFIGLGSSYTVESPGFAVNAPTATPAPIITPTATPTSMATPTPTPAPNPTATATSTPNIGGTGDVNNDGQVTIVDSLFVAQYTVGIRTFSTSQLFVADANCDGQVNVVDALFIAQYTVGTRTLTSTQLAFADVNGDGQVNIVDALFIAQYTVGLRQL